MTTATDSLALIARVYEAMNRRDLDGFSACFAPDFVDHGDSPPSVGPAAMQAHLAAFLAAFPDLHTTVDQVLVDGPWYASRTTTTGTHLAPLMDMPATGRAIRVPGIDFGRISDGLLRERWGGFDTFTLMSQLGTIPNPEQVPA